MSLISGSDIFYLLFLLATYLSKFSYNEKSVIIKKLFKLFF